MPATATATQCFSPTTLVAALEKALDFIGGPRRWASCNPKQLRLLQMYHEYVGMEELVPELKAFADNSAAVLNQILRDHGFSIQLDDWGSDPFAFGVVGLSDIRVEWLKEAKTCTITPANGGPAVPGIFAGSARVAHSNGLSDPVVQLHTKSGDVVCITEYPVIYDQFDLVSTIKAARDSIAIDYRPMTNCAMVPMVSLRQTVDINWLCGLSVGRWFVQQALQECRFGLNQFGARAIEASAIGMRATSMPPRPYVVDRPFLLWIERPGVASPVFQAYIGEDSWADPGDLDTV